MPENKQKQRESVIEKNRKQHPPCNTQRRQLRRCSARTRRRQITRHIQALTNAQRVLHTPHDMRLRRGRSDDVAYRQRVDGAHQRIGAEITRRVPSARKCKRFPSRR